MVLVIALFGCLFVFSIGTILVLWHEYSVVRVQIKEYLSHYENVLPTVFVAVIMMKCMDFIKGKFNNNEEVS